MDSQLPQGMSMDRLKEIEARKAEVSADADEAITAPKFITQIKSRAVVLIDCTENQRKITELDELKYSKSLNQVTSYAH